jgi:glucokinase
LASDNGQMNVISVGVDIGGGTVKIGVLEGSNILHREIFPTQASGCPERLLEQVKETLAGAGVDIQSVQALGIGAPALVHDGKMTHTGNLPGWIGVPLAAVISEHVNGTVGVYTDICTMAYAEHVAGALRSSTRGMVFTLGTGFGSAAVLDGNIYGGAIGLTLFPPWNAANDAARPVTIETLVAGPAIARHAEALACDARNLAEQARAGDIRAKAIWDQVGHHLGWAAYNIICLLWVDTLVFTGGISKGEELILEPARKFFREYGEPLVAEQCKLVCSSFPKDAGIIGAALAARDGRTQNQNLL